METKTNQIIKKIFRLLLFLPFMFLSFCQMADDDIMNNRETLYNIDSDITKLMLQVINKNNGFTKSSGTSDIECTGFVYPITFYAYFGDDPSAKKIEVENDQELLEFFNTLGTTNQYYIIFPVILTDAEGVDTTIISTEQLIGTLEMALDVCYGDDDDNDDSDDTNNDNSDDDGGLGIRYAHFDVDTAHLFYNFNDGKTDAHTHEYDEKYDTNIVDYFNIETGGKTGNSALHNIFDPEYGVPNNSEKFYVIVGNASLSQDVELEINGVRIPVLEYQAKVQAFMNGDQNVLEVYTLGNSQEATTLTSLKFIVGLDAATIDNGLIPTETSTVRSNTPGPDGEYRDGALIVQAINKNAMSLDTNLGVANANAGLFWESTIFWHRKSDDNNDQDNSDNDDCKCEGEVTSLDLTYRGNATNASVVLYEGKIESDKVITSFDNVNNGDVLSFTGEKKDNKMGKKILLVINGDIDSAVEIHTSCSKPIGIRMTFGDFEIIGGSSSKGGDFCDPGTGVYEFCDKKYKKVYICHKGNTICVSVNAIWGHINQHEEDYLGSCIE